MAERKLLKENTVAKEVRRKFPLVAQAQLGTTFGRVVQCPSITLSEDVTVYYIFSS